MKKTYLFAALLGGGLAIGAAAMIGRGAAGTAQHVLAADPKPARGAPLAGPAPASAPRAEASAPEYARIVKVVPIRRITSTARAPCLRPSAMPAEDDSMASSLADSLTGSVLDAVLGTTTDDGTDAAALIQPPDEARPARAGSTLPQRQAAAGKGCDSVLLASSRIVGYDIRYSLDGVEHTIRSKTRPSSARVPVKGGHLQLPG
ncbi:hypothetical protein [Paludibacterium yongneupense]|uniref:hypothetical protein n=1 Tax=Paludibacterium yongneupense TaxID=400061 RepID=UPI00048BD59E|nr:hypothetical protein [Paludibacterium yongneupense]